MTVQRLLRSGSAQDISQTRIRLSLAAYSQKNKSEYPTNWHRLRICQCCPISSGPLRYATIDERLGIINSQRDAVINQMQEMKDMLDLLNFKSWYYETAKKAGTCAIQNIVKIDEVPKQFRKFIENTPKRPASDNRPT